MKCYTTNITTIESISNALQINEPMTIEVTQHTQEREVRWGMSYTTHRGEGSCEGFCHRFCLKLQHTKGRGNWCGDRFLQFVGYLTKFK